MLATLLVGDPRENPRGFSIGTAIKRKNLERTETAPGILRTFTANDCRESRGTFHRAALSVHFIATIRYAPRSNGSNAPATIDDVIDDFRFVTSSAPLSLSLPPFLSPSPPSVPPAFSRNFPEILAKRFPLSETLYRYQSRAESVGGEGGGGTARSSDWLPANRANSSRLTHAFRTRHSPRHATHTGIRWITAASRWWCSTLDQQRSRWKILAREKRRAKEAVAAVNRLSRSEGKRWPRRLSILPRSDHWHD